MQDLQGYTAWGVGYRGGRGDVQVQDSGFLLLGGAVCGTTWRLGFVQGRRALKKKKTFSQKMLPSEPIVTVGGQTASSIATANG